jgi:hypothetical protein
MTSEEIDGVVAMSELLATRIYEDISQASTRAEHIRVTARANEARELAYQLRLLVK